jgi:hypothetical protein
MQRGNLATVLNSLGQLEKLIDELGTLPRKLAIEASPKLTKLLRKQFAAGTDSYGRTWRRLATGKRSHLTETGRLRAMTRAVPMLGGRMGIRLVFGTSYGHFHQTGTRNMPARRIFPQRGMPREWRDVLDASAKRLIRQAARGVK